jgi:cytochrome c-type biogenesis protein
MSAGWTAATLVFAYGVQAAIMPCPLAANVAAISYIGRRVGKPWLVLLGGALFALGQMLAYVGLAALIAWPALASDSAAAFLERYLTKALGPLMVIAGVFLLELVPVSFGGGISQGLRRRAESVGLLGALLLGAMLALAFCPTTAALFFLQLMPMALTRNPIVLPLLFAMGAAAPVMAMAVLLAIAANRVGVAFAAITVVEKWARRVTGAIFIGVGIYLTLLHVYGVVSS